MVVAKFLFLLKRTDILESFSLSLMNCSVIECNIEGNCNVACSCSMHLWQLQVSGFQILTCPLLAFFNGSAVSLSSVPSFSIELDLKMESVRVFSETDEASTYMT